MALFQATRLLGYFGLQNEIMYGQRSNRGKSIASTAFRCRLVVLGTQLINPQLTIQPQEILYGSRRGGIYMSVYSSKEPDIALRWCLDSYDGDSHKRRHCESFEDALLQLEHNKDDCLVLAINPQAADDEWVADEHRSERAPRSHEDQRTTDHHINHTYFQDMSFHYRRFRDFKRSRNPIFHDGILWEPHGQDIYYDEAGEE